MTYAASEIRCLMEHGTQPDEDFYRMKLTGNGGTNWFNVTPEQAEQIAVILDDTPTPDPLTRVLNAAADALERVEVGDAGEAEMILTQVVTLSGEYKPPKPS